MAKRKKALADAMTVQDLTVKMGYDDALRHINMAIPKACVSAIIGPSGSGKSVFLKSLNRLNELEGAKTSGKVLLEGEDVYSMKPEDLRRRVGMVFQNPMPFRMNIYNNVSYGPRLDGKTSRAQLDEIVESALRVVGLWEDLKGRLRRSPDSLTAGQMQRLCIARTLATQPEVLLLDEPTKNLGAGAGMLVEELLLQLAEGGITVVMATHNLQQAARVSESCAFFLGGRLVECSPTNTLFTRPGDERTEAYISGRLM